MTAAPSHRTVRPEDIPTLASRPDGLGIDGFGVDTFTAASEGDELVEPHSSGGEAGAAGHRELYVVVAGAARFTIDGDTVDAPAGTLVVVPDPGSRRGAVAAAAETTVLAIAAPAGDIVAEGMRFHTDEPSLLYNLACYESLSGRADEAIAHLARAIELDPRRAGWAATDADFDPIRMLPGFPAAG